MITPDMLPKAPPNPPPGSAMGGPMVPGMDGPNALLEALMGGGGGPPPGMAGPGGQPMLPGDMLNPNPSLDDLLQLLAQQGGGGQDPTGQQSMMGQVGPGSMPGPTGIDPEVMAMLMGGGGPPGP